VTSEVEGGDRRIAGRYRLIRPIASGGMARVWEADDEVLTRSVAVKLLHPHLAADDSFVARFRAEAISAARLTHPAIVSIYDTWSGDGAEAIVMELVAGTTLRHLIEARAPLPVDEAVVIADHVATALEAAHQAGIVHRDIKPANVLLSSDGRVLVTDFGIAKAAEGADLTGDGTMLGTAKYLAPEQVEGTSVDGRTDLYALGVVLYEMVCGQPPFRADTDAATALARLHRDPEPPSSLQPDIPAWLERVILDCLQRDPDRRPATATELRRRLAARSDTPAPAADPHPARPGAAQPGPVPGPPAAPHRAPAGPRRGGRHWPILALLAVSAVVAAVLATGIGLSSDNGSAGAVEIAAVAAFDPEGSPPGDEHNADAPKAADGDPTTAWSTETYTDPAHLGKTKRGVGLVVTFAEGVTVDTLRVVSPSVNWSASIYATEGAPGPDLEAWGDPVTGATGLGPPGSTFSLDGRRAKAVLIWITRTGDDGRVAIAEVTLTG
jgi:serine/threonine-protein kinase